MSAFIYEPFYDFDRVVGALFSVPQAAHNKRRRLENAENGNLVKTLRPSMDLHEDAEKNLVTASFELPGFNKEDIQIDLHNGHLIISAENKISSEHEENGYAVRERQYGKFSRTLQLPQGVKEEEVKAAMENGILTVTFPKTVPELAPKKITVA